MPEHVLLERFTCLGNLHPMDSTFIPLVLDRFELVLGMTREVETSDKVEEDDGGIVFW